MIIDDNTLYTQYRPSGQTATLCSTSSGSDSTSSCVPSNRHPNLNLLAPIATISSSSSSSVLMQLSNEVSDKPNATQTTNGNMRSYFGANRRECLFYHSTDNNRMNYGHRQQKFAYEQQLLKEQQKKFIERQQEIENHNNMDEEDEGEVRVSAQTDRDHASRILSKNSCIYSYSLINRPSSSMSNATTGRIEDLYSNKDLKHGKQASNTKPVVMHSVPFNSTNQVQPVAELFKEDILSSSRFDRSNLNQLSTKSHPSDLFVNHHHDGNNFLSSSNSTASSATSSSSTTPIENKPIVHHNHQAQQFRNIILPHPAQV